MESISYYVYAKNTVKIISKFWKEGGLGRRECITVLQIEREILTSNRSPTELLISWGKNSTCAKSLVPTIVSLNISDRQAHVQLNGFYARRTNILSHTLFSYPANRADHNSKNWNREVSNIEEQLFPKRSSNNSFLTYARNQNLRPLCKSFVN